jgi:hypothetical protein
MFGNSSVLSGQQYFWSSIYRLYDYFVLTANMAMARNFDVISDKLTQSEYVLKLMKYIIIN